jgi:general secretion pathway protein J
MAVITMRPLAPVTAQGFTTLGAVNAIQPSVGARSAMSVCGFTLIELLVAIFILAVLSVMSYRGFDAMARSNDHLADVTERWRAMALFFERFAADVAQPADHPARDNAGALLPVWLGRPLAEPANVDAQLEFTRKSPPGQKDVRVAYRLRERTLELLVWPVLDRAPASRPEVHAILENVNGVRLQYLDSRGSWQNHWPVYGMNEVLPRAVSVELEVAGEPAVLRVFALP